MLNHQSQRFPDKPVMIVEAAYYYLHDGKSWDGSEDFSQCPPGTIDGQREFTSRLVTELNRHPNVKWMLSNADCSAKNPDDTFFEELFAGFNISRVQAVRAINANPNKRGKLTELLIKNYE